MKENYLVEIFCNVKMDDLDKAVGETFTDLAFKAVEKITNVSMLKDTLKILSSNYCKLDGLSKDTVILF